MPIEILMPALSPTMTEGNLAKWLKKEGDKIEPGQVIAEIETDKATMEVEAVDEGILGKILVKEGSENVKVNELIALILEDGEEDSAIDEFIKTKASNQDQTETAKVEEPKKPQQTASENNHQKSTSANSNDRIFASPLAKRIAEQENINLSMVSGSGPNGRIIKEDVQNYMNSGSNKFMAVAAGNTHTVSQTVNTTSSATSNNMNKLPNVGVTNMQAARNNEEYTEIKLDNMRKIIAKRLLESKQTIPHFYLNIECNLDKLLAVRKEMNLAAGDNPAYKLSVNDFIIYGVAKSLSLVPEANSAWGNDSILQFNNVDVSVAVAIDGGLITPIIRNADLKTISQISNEMKDLANRARANSLKPEEFQGGGFTISNLGMFGVKSFNAIINPPQSCILSVGQGVERVIIKDGEFAKATIAEINLSSDHRVVDGAVGAKFLSVFKNFLENPMSMFV